MQDFSLWCQYALGILSYVFILIRTGFIGYARLKQTEVKRIDMGMDIIFLIFFLCYEIITYFLLVFASKFTWSNYQFIPWIAWLGFSFCIISLLLFIWVHLALGRNTSIKVQIKEKQKLITKGPYNLIRHPLYTSLLILHVGVLLMISNWFIGISWFTSLLLFLVFRIPKEERMLLEEFGELYQDYSETRGRIFPKFLNLIKKMKSKQ